MINYVYPETLPSQKARSVSAVNTACELAKLIDTTLYYEKSDTDIANFYGLECEALRLEPISKRFVIRSNKIFNFHLKRKINDGFFYVRHLKVAKELINEGKKVIFEIHEIFSDINPKVYELEKFVYENAMGIVCVNQTVKGNVEQKFRVNVPIKVIYNGCGFDVDFLKKDFSKIDKMFYIGSTQKWKGVDFLLEGISESDIVLNIVGEKPKGEAPKNVRLQGFKSKEEVLDILKKAKLTVIPNLPYKESYFSVPIKLFEYMRTSNIVISSDFAPIREIVKDKENGFLFRAGDIESFKKTLKYVLSLRKEELERVSMNAYETATTFTWERRAERIVEFVKELQRL